MRLVVQIDLGNEGMQSRRDVHEAFRRSLMVEGFQGAGVFIPLEVGEEGRLRDENGNTVGLWKVVPGNGRPS